VTKRAWYGPVRDDEGRLVTRCQHCRRRRGVHRHHVVSEQHVRRAGGDPWDPANRMLLCLICHAAHTAAVWRLRVARIPDAALAFAVDLFGDERRAADYFQRYYSTQEG
jgi:ribosomal protein S14